MVKAIRTSLTLELNKLELTWKVGSPEVLSAGRSPGKGKEDLVWKMGRLFTVSQ